MLGRLLILILAAAAPPAYGLLIDSGTGVENTSPPPDDPGWANVGKTGGLAAVYLGHGWVISASHVAYQDVVFGGVSYARVPGTHVVLTHSGTQPADLALWRVSPEPPLPALQIRALPPQLDSEIILVGPGQNRGIATSWNGIGGYVALNQGAVRWGTNQVLAIGEDIPYGIGLTRSFSFDFTPPPPGLLPDLRCSGLYQDLSDRCPEAQARPGDSGGAVFERDAGGAWKLAGVMHTISLYEGQPDNVALYGNLSFTADLSYYRDQILAITDPCAAGGDTDGDGVADACDNCWVAPNPGQVDADGDLFGNACDGDFDQSGLSMVGDFNTFRVCLGRSVGPGGPQQDPSCAESDMDGSGVVSIGDAVIFNRTFGRPPGPSGLVP